MTEETSTIALLGLPRTGKSTYLGALWRLVQDAEVPEIFERDFSGDRSRINMLADNVSDGNEIERTEVDSEEGFEVEVGFGDGHAARLEIPDLSGEATRELVEERIWRRSLANTLQRAAAVLIFVHPDKVVLPIPANFGAPDGPADESEGTEDPDFAAGNACTASKLVELLENVIDLRSDAWPMRIGVIVSAWDRVAGSPTPRDWLEDRMPGVAGLLLSNRDQVRTAAFGVSAQGGRLPNDRELLLAKGGVRERVFASGPTGESTGLWEPIRWALGFEE
jgi:hypothetical protein